MLLRGKQNLNLCVEHDALFCCVMNMMLYKDGENLGSKLLACLRTLWCNWSDHSSLCVKRVSILPPPPPPPPPHTHTQEQIMYWEKSVKESEENIRDMVSHRREK